jgi:hypothetical protein
MENGSGTVLFADNLSGTVLLFQKKRKGEKFFTPAI